MKFSLENYFITNTNHQEHIPVQLPYHGSFKVNPEQQDSPLLYILYKNNKWWLIHPEIAETFQIPKLCTAKLYEAMYDDGTILLIPVTEPSNTPESIRWHDSLLDAIELAKKRWVSMESDRNAGQYKSKKANPEDPVIPEWSDNLGHLLEKAFKHRTIDTEEQLDHLLNKGRISRSNNDIEEE